MKINLDQSDTLLQLDKTQLFEATAHYSSWIADGYTQAKALEVKALSGKVDEIVMCSVGGGPVASLVQLKSLLFDEIRVPIILSQAYSMPAYVDDDSIVFIVNYSGGSEEVVSAYRHAITTGAMIIVLTAGGKARELAEQNGHLLFHARGQTAANDLDQPCSCSDARYSASAGADLRSRSGDCRNDPFDRAIDAGLCAAGRTGRQ